MRIDFPELVDNLLVSDSPIGVDGILILTFLDVLRHQFRLLACVDKAPDAADPTNNAENIEHNTQNRVHMVRAKTILNGVTV